MAASASPWGPVAALALPAWASTDRAWPVSAIRALVHRTGAEAKRCVVNLPAAVAVCWLVSRARSGPGPGASPALTPAARNPLGAHTPPSTPATV